MAAVVMSLYVSRATRSILLPNASLTKYRFSQKATEAVTNNLEITVNVSDSCIARLQELGPNTTLRVGVDGGGCSGFQYNFELDTSIEKDDKVIEKNGVSVVIDEVSMQYLKGSTIEYHSELIKSAFRVVNNPLAEHGCSCGASFNVKIT